MGSTTLPTPKYAQIAERIISEIRRGQLPLGSQIPSQSELMNEYAVSTTTARKSLQELDASAGSRALEVAARSSGSRR